MFDVNEEAGQEEFKYLPIYLKAEEICQLVDSMLMGADSEELNPTDSMKAVDSGIVKDLFNYNKSHMLTNSLVIPTKITGAEVGNVFDLRMENASIIRTAARELITGTNNLQHGGFRDVEYLDLLRVEIDLFRILFVEWVISFDLANYITDRWGLFNPPGVNYDDPDQNPS